MHLLIHALLFAVLLPGDAAVPEPSCKARLSGRLLTTTIKFENGYGMEAPWQVLQTQRAFLSEDRSILLVDLTLDRIVEFDEITGHRSTTALPQPVQVRVEGVSDTDVVSEAADTWCSSVLKARGPEQARGQLSLHKPGRIT
jgi:hypothetical protein